MSNNMEQAPRRPPQQGEDPPAPPHDSIVDRCDIDSIESLGSLRPSQLNGAQQQYQPPPERWLGGNSLFQAAARQQELKKAQREPQRQANHEQRVQKSALQNQNSHLGRWYLSSRANLESSWHAVAEGVADGRGVEEIYSVLRFSELPTGGMLYVLRAHDDVGAADHGEEYAMLLPAKHPQAGLMRRAMQGAASGSIHVSLQRTVGGAGTFVPKTITLV